MEKALLTSNLPGEDKMKEAYDLIGLGFALAVPVLGAWIAIITRSAGQSHGNPLY